ncbi:hypothetical protein C9439_02980 [archaeon SCG-AAA382B04]|nr:hypothetical protein C9439_02980 [archaeon SCG-AAA382B04]
MPIKTLISKVISINKINNIIRIKMTERVVTSINIDEPTLRKAKSLGLNISKVTENALKIAVSNLENTYKDIDKEKHFKNRVRGRGFEPLDPYGTAPSRP